MKVEEFLEKCDVLQKYDDRLTRELELAIVEHPKIDKYVAEILETAFSEYHELQHFFEYILFSGSRPLAPAVDSHIRNLKFPFSSGFLLSAYARSSASDEDKLQIYTKHLEHEDSYCRATACILLGRFSSKEDLSSIDGLCSCLSDRTYSGDETIAQYALSSLLQIAPNDKTVIEAISEAALAELALEDKEIESPGYYPFLAEACSALSKIGYYSDTVSEVLYQTINRNMHWSKLVAFDAIISFGERAKDMLPQICNSMLKFSEFREAELHVAQCYRVLKELKALEQTVVASVCKRTGTLFSDYLIQLIDENKASWLEDEIDEKWIRNTFSEDLELLERLSGLQSRDYVRVEKKLNSAVQ